MSESTGAMEQFNINELAGATGLILGSRERYSCRDI